MAIINVEEKKEETNKSSKKLDLLELQIHIYFDPTKPATTANRGTTPLSTRGLGKKNATVRDY